MNAYKASEFDEKPAPTGSARAVSDRRQDQTARAVVEIALCLADVLHEADASVTTKVNFAAGLSYNRLKASGDDEAAEIVYAFGRALLDRDRFPRPDDDI